MQASFKAIYSFGGCSKPLSKNRYFRGVQLPSVKHLVTVTNRELFFKKEDEFREVSTSPVSTSFVLEPFGWNTAPAVTAAAIQVVQAHGPDDILLLLAANHLIADQVSFQQAEFNAVELAQQGKLVTFRVQPYLPETGCGYIESDSKRVLRYVEKPLLGKSEDYLCAT